MANAFIQWSLGLVLGVIGGALGTTVALRTRLAMIERDIRDEKAARIAMAERMDGRIESIDRRQLVMLRLTADIARKVGVDGRTFDDALVRMLTTEEDK